MGGLSIWHLIALAAIVYVLFGRKFSFSDMMGDVAKGMKAFKSGMADDTPAEDAAKTLDAKAGATVDKASDTSKVG